MAVKKGAAYKDSQIKPYSWLSKAPDITKQANEIAGNSRVFGDISAENQALVIDLLVEIGTRYKLSYREIAYLLLLVRVESGFNPDAAAGTTSAAGLAQYTKATVAEAKKPNYSKHYLGFELNLDEMIVFDAQRGAYGALLSYFICRTRAKEFFPNALEANIYLFHHEGWYFNPKGKEDNANVIAVRKIIEDKILAKLPEVERLLKQKTEVQFSLKTSDGKPYANQPFAVVLPQSSSGQHPGSVQHQQAVKVVTGVTDGAGRTPKLEAAGLSEVVFSILNVNYKKLLQHFPGRGTGKITSYKVKSGDSLSSIAKAHKTTVSEIAKANGIRDVNKISVGQVLRLPGSGGDTAPAYWWRRPEMDWLASVLAPHIGAEGLEDTAAVVEHKRSHVVLPTGNKAHDGTVAHNNVIVAGTKSQAQVAASTTAQKVPHQTNETKAAKPVAVQSSGTGQKKVITGLLYPLVVKATANYHEGARRFGSGRTGGRKHAGIDLYAPTGTVVRAMAPGKVLRVYAFYCGTSAIEIDHGSFIARYGEVDSKRDKIYVEPGDKVERGEKIGVVGRLVGIKVPSNMLHLEMYGSSSHADLTVKGNPPYQRRDDLIDPTPSIDQATMQ
ncbi:MAG: hypothetical protein C4K60_07915 [Ideonella sp. MAG2]|nr:MAG: hypothetical protein C4K60_07915 [Ideonella sp. MAG2]